MMLDLELEWIGELAKIKIKIVGIKLIMKCYEKVLVFCLFPFTINASMLFDVFSGFDLIIRDFFHFQSFRCTTSYKLMENHQNQRAKRGLTKIGPWQI